jgi:hypothetical protein
MIMAILSRKRVPRARYACDCQSGIAFWKVLGRFCQFLAPPPRHQTRSLDRIANILLRTRSAAKMKRKAFELVSSYESEDDGSNDHAEREGASLRECPSPAEYGDTGAVRDQVEERGHDKDLGRLIAQSRVLRNLAERNRAIIASRRLTFCGRAQRVRASRVSGSDTSPSTMSLRQRWRLYLSTLDPLFFAESTIQGEHLGTDGVSASAGGRSLAVRSDYVLLSGFQKSSQIYAALRLSEENNEDIADIFQKKWAAKAIRGQPLNSYAQFRVCVGQLARFCTTLNLVKAEDLCERGEILRLVCELEIVQGFVGFWQARAASSTIIPAVVCACIGVYTQVRELS